MKCPKCGSENVNVTLEQIKGVTNHRSIVFRIGRLCLIICTCGLWLLIPKMKEKTKFKNKTVGLCQNCGNKFTV